MKAPKPKRISDKMIKHIVARYKAGDTMKSISDDVPYSASYVSKIIRGYNISRGKGRKAKIKISIKEILKRYSEGESSISIAKDAGCSGSNIRKIIKNKGKTIKIKRPAMDTDFEEINDFLHKSLQQDYPIQFGQVKKSVSTYNPEFLGHVDAYYYLSRLIPLDTTIYDMGCCWGFQSYFFKDHKKYIGVDANQDGDKQIKLPNNEYHNCTIKEFLKKNEIDQRHFAICNYVVLLRFRVVGKQHNMRQTIFFG